VQIGATPYVVGGRRPIDFNTVSLGTFGVRRNHDNNAECRT
jgi:hypothetical protein